MIKKIFWLSGLLWFYTGGLYAQETLPALSLSQLVDSALQNNYLLQANTKNILIKQAEIEILKTEYRPRVDAFASFSYWNFLLPNKEKLLGNASTDMYTDFSITQTIYDWGENKMKKSVVEDEIRLNEEVRRQIRNTIILGISDTYFEALKSESKILVHQISLDQLKSQLQYSDNLYKIGKVSGVDVLKIQLQIAEEEKAMQKARNAAISQQIKIKRLCYLSESASILLEDNSKKLFKENQNRVFSNDSLYYTAVLNHPVLLASDQKIVIETKQTELYRLQNRPKLFSYGVANWEHAYIPFYDNFNFNIGAGIRYTLPYWGGSSYKSKILQSNYRIEQMTDEKNQFLQDVKEEIDLALNAINDIKGQIANNQEIIRLSGETLKNAEIKYQSGQGNIIDVLDAQKILTLSTISYNESTIEYLQAIARLHYLSGNDSYPF